MVLKIIQLCLNFAKTLTLRSYTLPTSGPNLAFECFWCLGTHWHELVPMKPRGISSMSIAGSFNSHVAEDIRIYQGCQGWRESGACGATRDFSHSPLCWDWVPETMIARPQLDSCFDEAYSNTVWLPDASTLTLDSDERSQHWPRAM